VAYVKTTQAKAAKRTRVRVPRFERTEEWRMMKADIDRGLAPGSVLQVGFTEDDMRKYRITNRRTVARYLKNYLAARKLSYRVKSFQSDLGGFFVLVLGPPAKSTAHLRPRR
jgi:hypothetical protein